MSDDSPLILSTKPGPLTPCLALRPREAAAALSVSERTLWEWTQRGEVPHVRRGKTILYPVSVLEDWLTQQASRGGDDERQHA